MEATLERDWLSLDHRLVRVAKYKRSFKYDPSFNWFAVLKDLAAGAPLDQENYLNLVDRACLWETCACGQLCRSLPRHFSGDPKDCRLKRLGGEFMIQIWGRNWVGALKTMHQIEARSIYLLAEQNGPA